MRLYGQENQHKRKIINEAWLNKNKNGMILLNKRKKEDGELMIYFTMKLKSKF